MDNHEFNSTEETPISAAESRYDLTADSDSAEPPRYQAPPLPVSAVPPLPAPVESYVPPQNGAPLPYNPIPGYGVPPNTPSGYAPLPYGSVPTHPMGYVKAPPRRNHLIAGMLGLFLGGFGAHRFYMGYYKVGTIMLLLALSTPIWAWLRIPPFVFLWGFIDGIWCLVGKVRDANGNPLVRW